MDTRKSARIMGYLLLGAGIGHFLFPAPLDSIVPSALPGDPRIYTYLSGVAEIAIGLALLSKPTLHLFGKSLRLWGALGAFALFIAVYPANINMAIEWSDRRMPDPLFAYARLPFQFYFLYIAWNLARALSREEK
jgi:uncharacterized membrane protein